MNKMSCRVAMAALATMLATAGPAIAQPPPAYYLSLSDLQNLFVTQHQYFVFDNEQATPTASLYNHFHISQLDTTTGAFQGAIWAPVVPPYIAGQQSIPVTGMITINSDVGDYGFSWHVGDFYQITFSWALSGPCYNQTASYDGAITFLGYEGTGKMHGTISGTISATYAACMSGGAKFGPIAFSGQLTK